MLACCCRRWGNSLSCVSTGGDSCVKETRQIIHIHDTRLNNDIYVFIVVWLLTLSEYLLCRRWENSELLILWMMFWISSLCVWWDGRLMSSRALWCCCRQRSQSGNVVNMKQTYLCLDKITKHFLPAPYPASHSAESGGLEDLGCRDSECWYSVCRTCQKPTENFL